MDKKFYRVIDANFNRVREALRVSEDVTRFVLDSGPLTRDLKSVRLAVSERLKSIPCYRKKIISARSADRDVGRPTLRLEAHRRNYDDILFANLERAKESLRVLEEFFKLVDKGSSEVFKGLRYTLYGIEKKLAKKVACLSRAR